MAARVVAVCSFGWNMDGGSRGEYMVVVQSVGCVKREGFGVDDERCVGVASR